MSLEERLEQAEKLVAEVKAELAAMRATKRNWPERIEAGMVFRHKEGAVYLFPARECDDLICVSGDKTDDPGAYFSRDLFFSESQSMIYLGHARDILAIRTAAHEPTGAELVGVLEDIRNVSNNPGRTLTTLGLTECLQSCNVMARKALEGLAK